MAFVAELEGIPPTVLNLASKNKYAIVVASGGNLISVVRSNDPAPGFTAGTKLQSLQLQAFTAHGLLLSAAIVGESQGDSLWLWNDTGLSLVAVSNAAHAASLDVAQNHITVGGNTCYIQNFNLGVGSSAQMNNQGDIVFAAYLSSTTPSAECSGGGVTLVEKRNDIFYPLIRAGEAIPNLESGTFRGFFSFALADDGKVGFSDISKWVVDNTGSKLLMSFPGEKLLPDNSASIGDNASPPLAGTAGDYLVSSGYGFLLGSPRLNPYTSAPLSSTSPLAALWSWIDTLPGYNNPVLSSFQQWSYTRSGGLFFLATVLDGEQAEQALWLRDVQGQLTKMIATGDTISGSTSKIKGITLVSGSVMNGRPASVSDNNFAVVEVLLEDRSEAILVISH
jgi:hypothetical protein